MSMIIGVDPGITGAIYFGIYNNTVKQQIRAVYDMPIMSKTSGKGNQINARALADMIRDYIDSFACVPRAYVESVNAMPKQGVTSVFSFGKSAGIIEGILAALQIPVVMVTPQCWKKRAGIMGKEKDAARTKAILMYPEIASSLSRKKDIGRAEAILIAEFGQDKAREVC